VDPQVALLVSAQPMQIAEKQRYAKWKTLDIMKALKEGRVPASGPADVRTMARHGSISLLLLFSVAIVVSLLQP
jgi:hypothetical protein